MSFFWSTISFLSNIFIVTVFVVILCVFVVHELWIQEQNLNVARTKDNMASDCNDILPEIYINSDVLKPLVLDCIPKDYEDPPIYDKVYEINGTIFREDVWKDNGTLSEFEIHTTNTNGELEVKIRDTVDVYLPVSIQETPYGLIINSNVLLTVSQWNTLVELGDTRQCAVCDTNISSTIDHIESDIHLRNLEKCQPLKKFDLSITRLIDDTYHCGVCNERFDRNAENEHFDSKPHEENMLFATNRASDVLYDFDIHDQYKNSDFGNTDNGNKNNDCYHFNRNRLLSVSDTSGFDSAEGFYDYDFDDNVPYYTDNENESNDTWSTGNDNEYNVIDNAEYNQPNYVSYASMAKKVAATPDYLYVTVFGKIMKIKFDHWHMLSTFKSMRTNQIYCMVCKKYYPTTQKVQHCAEKTHLDQLKRYSLVKKYKDYIIRNMGFKYYHCGVCNNIQLTEQIDQHIELKHKKKVTPALHSEVVPKNNDNKDTRNSSNVKLATLPLLKIPQNITTPQVKDTTNTDTDSKTVMSISNENLLNVARNTNTENQVAATTTTMNKNNSNDTIPNRKTNVTTLSDNHNDNAYEINNESPIYNDIVVNQFGFKIRISFISYNLITKNRNCYDCHICRMTASDKDMTRHVTEQEHTVKLSGMQFKANYGIHLIRMIGIQDHCAICNVTFNMEHTSKHILDTNHIKNLTKALAINASQNHLNSVLNPPRIDSNQHAIHQPTVGINQHAMHQPTMGINQPAMAMNQPAMAMNQPAMAMNQPAISKNQPAMSMNQPAMSMNQPAMAMNQPAMAMNRPAIYPPIMGLNPLPMHPPIISMNQPPILPPPMFMHQPILPPTITLQPGQPGLNLNQMHTNQRETNINQRTTIMPNLEINQSNPPKNIQPNSDKNQRDTIESQTINQSRIDMNQRATNESKVESQIESIHDMFEMIEPIDDVDDDIEYFKERFVYLKFKNTYVQVALGSYHSLIKIGDGSVYCFVCSLRVYGSMKKHVDSTNHAKCMDDCKFVSKYDKHLLRQMFLNYHCSICNVIFTRKYINKHITWPVHALEHKTDKKARKRDLKSGRKLITVSFQNEAIYLNEKETEIKILIRLEQSKSNSQSLESLQKKNKIIIVDKKVLKISWDAYHGLNKNKNGHRCVLCQSDVRGYELSAHIGGEYHRELLDKFQTQHLPHLLREINESTLNCVICNVEVANKEHIISDHIYGKKHKKTYDDILLDSCTVDSYADCNDDVLNLSF